MSQAVPPPGVPFENSTPILRVEDMEAAVAFYTGALGFANAPWGDAHFTCVTRDRAAIYLCRGSQGHPGGTWVWLGVGDAMRLHEDLVARGVAIRLPPTNYPWALEVHVEDVDGHVLRFGSEPLPDVPFSEWVETQETPQNRAQWTRPLRTA